MSLAYDHGEKDRHFNISFTSDGLVFTRKETNEVIQKMTHDQFTRLRNAIIDNRIARINFESGIFMTRMMSQNIEALIVRVKSFNLGVQEES